jgi:hypothetical protein
MKCQARRNEKEVEQPLGQVVMGKGGRVYYTRRSLSWRLYGRTQLLRAVLVVFSGIVVASLVEVLGQAKIRDGSERANIRYSK